MKNEILEIETLVMVSDHLLWALRPFIHLWEKYAGPSPLLIAGFSVPDFELPEFATFLSLGDFADYPADRWSDAFLKALDYVGDRFILLLEDFWLTRPVNIEAVNDLATLSYSQNHVLRIDLTTDRLNATTTDDAPAAVDVGHWRGLDLIESRKPSPYLMSTMGGIWNRDLLMPLVVTRETPWEFEIQGSARVNLSPWSVMGTRQFPMRHTIAVQRGKIDLSASWMKPVSAIDQEDADEMQDLGYFNGRL